MKITVNQLRRIIKEEVSRVLNETTYYYSDAAVDYNGNVSGPNNWIPLTGATPGEAIMGLPPKQKAKVTAAAKKAGYSLADFDSFYEMMAGDAGTGYPFRLLSQDEYDDMTAEERGL